MTGKRLDDVIELGVQDAIEQQQIEERLRPVRRDEAIVPSESTRQRCPLAGGQEPDFQAERP